MLKYIFILMLLSAIDSMAKVITYKDLTREFDPIIIKGEKLNLFLGKEIDKIRVYAHIDTDKGFIPIPFQIDKKDMNGEFVFTEIKNALFDKNDELVFMAKDLGNQITTAELPKGYEVVSEVEVRDLLNYTRGWVYVLYFPVNPPPRSQIDYVEYIKKEEKIVARNYILQFSDETPIIFDKLILTKEGGGNGTNLIDRLKIRAWGKLNIGIKVALNEDDFECYVVSYLDGPVRVIRRTVNRVIFWGIFSSPKAISDEYFYYSFFEFPFVVDIPFDVKDIFRNTQLRLTIELQPSAIKRKFYNANNLHGVTIDGVMAEEEKNLNLSPFSWMAHAGTEENEYGTWIGRLIIVSEAPLQPTLYYMDDESKLNSPENFPGEFGNMGFYMDNFHWVKKGIHKFICYLYNLPEKFDTGDEKKILNILDNPLKIWVGKVIEL